MPGDSVVDSWTFRFWIVIPFAGMRTLEANFRSESVANAFEDLRTAYWSGLEEYVMQLQ